MTILLFLEARIWQIYSYIPVLQSANNSPVKQSKSIKFIPTNVWNIHSGIEYISPKEYLNQFVNQKAHLKQDEETYIRK